MRTRIDEMRTRIDEIRTRLGQLIGIKLEQGRMKFEQCRLIFVFNLTYLKTFKI